MNPEDYQEILKSKDMCRVNDIQIYKSDKPISGNIISKDKFWFEVDYLDELNMTIKYSYMEAIEYLRPIDHTKFGRML